MFQIISVVEGKTSSSSGYQETRPQTYHSWLPKPREALYKHSGIYLPAVHAKASPGCAPKFYMNFGVMDNALTEAAISLALCIAYSSLRRPTASILPFRATSSSSLGRALTSHVTNNIVLCLQTFLPLFLSELYTICQPHLIDKIRLGHHIRPPRSPSRRALSVQIISH